MLLVEGSSGNQVKYLQYGLRIKCFNPKNIDGIFGPSTTTAVKRYQTSKGLSADGKVGDGTWNALKDDIKTIQQALKRKGYYSGTVDGVAGEGTYNALVKFQKEQDLTADGMAGQATLDKLYDDSGESYPILKLGSSGAKVKELQTKLIALGYYCGKTGADGSFGTGTYNTVIAFQKTNKLTADGIAGQKTWEVLNSGKAIDNDSTKYPLLKQGSTGEAVIRLQNTLIGLNYDCGSTGADGNFGPGTTRAVTSFQTANGLTADGIVGRMTWEVLNSGAAVPNTNTTPTLKRGDKGEYVKKLQTALINLGYNCGNAGADGSFGSGTYDAVVLFQKKNSLVSDGIVGTKTWNKLTSGSAVANDTASDLLKLGSKGVLVKELQSRLLELKYNCGNTGADGIFGAGTYNAVASFQRINGLSADGIVGPKTWEILRSDTAKPYDGSVQPSYPGTIHGTAESCRDAIIEEARYWIGKIPYCINTVITTMVLDKNSPPPYMDCSDFTSSVYLTVLGINIGGLTSVQIKRGTAVEYKDMKPGDLILFDWELDGATNHVGLYAGNGQFIDEHGSNSNPSALDPANQNIRISPITDYQKSRILGIRRIIQDNNTIINKPGEVIPIPNDDTTASETTIEKAILLTSHFEGNNGYSTITGNFDGAGLSLGIIQFNIKSNSLQPLLQQMVNTYPDMTHNIFGDNYQSLKDMLTTSINEQLNWAKSINNAKNTIVEPWKSQFVALCQTTEFQKIQRSGIQNYIDKAFSICNEYELTTERGLALAFDISVQNGSVKSAAKEIINSQLSSATAYMKKLSIIANAVADASNYPDDVRSRKMTIVNGTGVVHGKTFNLSTYDITDNTIIK